MMPVNRHILKNARKGISKAGFDFFQAPLVCQCTSISFGQLGIIFDISQSQIQALVFVLEVVGLTLSVLGTLSVLIDISE